MTEAARTDLSYDRLASPERETADSDGAKLLDFLESMIGGMSLRGVPKRPATPAKASDEEKHTLPSALSADAFRDAVRAYKAEMVDHQASKREAQLERQRQIKALLDQHVSGDQWSKMLDQAKLAARSGEQEFMMLRVSLRIFAATVAEGSTSSRRVGKGRCAARPSSFTAAGERSSGRRGLA